MLNKKSSSYKIIETKILQIIAIAFSGVLLTTCLYSSIGDKIIWIGITIALIELIVFVSNNSLDFFYKKLILEETNRKK